MSLTELLEAQQIRTALIVDDALDLTPTAADMRMNSDEWATFSDDLGPAGHDLIGARYPESVALTFQERVQDDQYVAAVWDLRDQLGDSAVELFALYESKQRADLYSVELLKTKLERLGLQVAMRGCAFDDQPLTADLVVIDLYLGASQDGLALNASKMQLAEVLKPRASHPPLVLLMSSSDNLEDKRHEFQKEVRLVDSGFRIIKKTELDGDRLEILLERLALNFADTLRLARFISALDSGIHDAANKALDLMRRLKLSDVVQIQKLLLDVEGEPPGSYLVDVFDRVLQHEIEGQKEIIAAAIELNAFSAASYPPQHVNGSPDLQELVERTLTQHIERLHLPGALGGVVAFGDVLRSAKRAPGARRSPGPLSKLTELDALLVLTPACDLQRAAAPRVLLLVGAIHPVSAPGWTYTAATTTSAIRIDGELKSISWDVKDVVTIPFAELERLLKARKLDVVARLREAHALEVQQRVLSDFGRVGLIAPMPGTFAASVEAFVLDPNGVPAPLPVPELDDEAVCFVGRNSKNSSQTTKLVLTERGCDGLLAAVRAIDPATVHPRARQALTRLQSSEEFRKQLPEGLGIATFDTDQWSRIAFPDNGGKNVMIGWNRSPDVAMTASKDQKTAGIILLVRDKSVDPAMSIEAAVQSGAVQPPHAP